MAITGNTTEALATSLLRCVGREEACDMARRNSWYGVLAAIEGWQRPLAASAADDEPCPVPAGHAMI